MSNKRSYSSSRGQFASNSANQELPPSQHQRIDSDAGGIPRRRSKLPDADSTVAPPQVEEQSAVFSDVVIAKTQVSQMLQSVETLLNPGPNRKNTPPASSAVAQPPRQRRQLHQQHQQQEHQFSEFPSDTALGNTLPFSLDTTFPFSPNDLLESLPHLCGRMQAANVASVNQTRVLETQLVEANQQRASALAEVELLRATCMGLRDDIKSRDSALQAKDAIIAQLHAEMTRRSSEAQPVTLPQMEHQLASLRDALCGTFQLLLEKSELPHASALGFNVRDAIARPKTMHATDAIAPMQIAAAASLPPPVTPALRLSGSNVPSQHRQRHQQQQMQLQLQQYQQQRQQLFQQPHQLLQHFQPLEISTLASKNSCNPFSPPSPLSPNFPSQLSVSSPNTTIPVSNLKIVSPAAINPPDVSMLSSPLSSQAQACSDQAKRFVAAGNLAAAAELQAQAISFGHLPSRADLAWILTDGRQGVPKNCQRAFQLVEQGARLKCSHCLGGLARCLAGGFGCAKDPERCLQLARESAAAGSRYGQYMVGWLHHTGWVTGVKNLDEAAVYYRLASAQNLDGAQFGMGWMYEHGEGVVKDKIQALQWYRFAAEQGHPLACDKMAHFYDAGIVVAQDKDEAVRWFRRALLGGLAQAEHDLARLSANQDTNNNVAGPSSAVAGAPASSSVTVASAPVLPAPVTAEKNEAALLGVQCAHRSSAGSTSASMQLSGKSNSKESGSKS